MSSRGFLIGCLLLLSAPICSLAQGYRFARLDAADGLSDNRVTNIYKDRTGFLWIATISGLNRFDGHTIKVYRHDPDDSTSLPHDDLRGVFESPDGRMCVVTASGVCFYNPKDETFSYGRSELKRLFGLPSENLTKIVRDNDGKYWFLLADSGVVHYDPEQKHSLHLRHHPHDTTTISSNRVSAIVQHPDKSYWLFHANGVLEKLVLTNSGYKIAFRKYTFGATKESNNSYLPGDILIDSDGDLWIYVVGRPLGAYFFDVKTQELRHIHSRSPGAGLATDIVSAMVQDNNGMIWISTDHGGINVVDKKTFSIRNIRNHPENENSLSLNSITTMVKDDEGIIWVGTYKKGVSYYHENIKRFQLYNRYSEPYGLPYEDINGIVEDDLGNLWIGTNGGGLIYFNRQNGKFTTYRHDPLNTNSLSSDVIVSLFIDHQKKLWIGTYFGGVSCFDGKNFTRYKNDPANPKSLSGTSVWEIFEDSQKRLWVGTLDGGLNLFDRETKTFHRQETLYNPYISELMEDDDGSIWVGTSYGIFVLKRASEKFIHYYREGNQPSALMDNNILCMHQDAKQRIWIGTLGGLSLFDKATETFRTFTRKDGLPHNAVITMLEDSDGNLWLTTPEGLTQMMITDTTSLGVKFRNYSEADGLQGKLFNENAALRTRSGELIFGGPNGLNIFMPEQLGQHLNKPTVIFSDFQLFNKSVKPGENIDGDILLSSSITLAPDIVLPASKNVFSIEFSTLNFFQAEKTIYKYKLEGFNNDWLFADSKSREVTFTNLDAGEYTFRVMAANNDGVWSDKAATLHIKVLPPFWKSKVAFILYTLLIVLALLITRKIIQQREELKFAIEHERQEALRMHELDMMKIKFFTNVSHEFRTPISLILSPVEKLMRGNVSAQDQNKHFDLIQRNAKRLLNLVNQLLDFRKLEVHGIKFQPSEGDIIKFIREAVYSFSDLSEKKNIRLEFQTSVSSLETVFDADKLEKILFNLLSNAFKFTQSDGRVSADIALTGTLNERFLQISVSDTGIGIPVEKQDKIFERFFQTELPKSIVNQGSGIGLSITKEFVKIHGGSIKVESEPGRGSCFTVTLPVKEIQPVSILPSTEPVRQPDQNEEQLQPVVNDEKAVLLLVEDNEDFRFYLKDNLSQTYNIVEASSGEEGWKKVLSSFPDLIVSDVMMPGMNGLELCQKVKSDNRVSHVPIILLTARSADEQRLEGLESGADDYINKPFNFEILESRIRNLILQRKMVHKSILQSANVKASELKITPLDEQFIKSAIEYVEKNVSNAEYSVEHLCRDLALSRTLFFRKMMSLTGKSPLEFIRTIRMQQAAQLLEKSQLTVAEVAYKVGFNNPKYFAKYFKEIYHLLPSAYAAGKRRNAS